MTVSAWRACVTGAEAGNAKIGKKFPYPRNVIQGQKEFSAQIFQKPGQSGKILPMKHILAVILLTSEIGRVNVEERILTVIAHENFLVRKAFNSGLCKALVCPAYYLVDSEGVEVSWL